MSQHGYPIWYELLTPDHDTAKRFYEAAVGWTIGPRPPGDIDYRMIATPDGGHVGGVMQLTDAMATGGTRPGWLFYIGVDDVDATADRVSAAGGAVLMPPFDIPGVGRAAFVTDPQGASFYIMRGASEAESTVFSPGRHGHASWQELFTTDDAGALAFYADVFGWRSPASMPMGPGRDYHFVHTADDVVLGGLGRAVSPDEAPRWRFYFEVPDLDTAMVRITAGGGEVTSGPHEVPGGSRMIQGADPTGAAFALVSARKES